MGFRNPVTAVELAPGAEVITAPGSVIDRDTTDPISVVAAAAASGSIPPNVPFSAVTARNSLVALYGFPSTGPGGSRSVVLLGNFAGTRYLLRSHVLSADLGGPWAVNFYRWTGVRGTQLWSAYVNNLGMQYLWGYFALQLGEGLEVTIGNTHPTASGVFIVTLNCDTINA
ncbi:MAG: hypothetical protein LC798_05225 [Chloroflexi bacterium]|nr:hypothetical protein [Chloroflexota bacterium]